MNNNKYTHNIVIYTDGIKILSEHEIAFEKLFQENNIQTTIYTKRISDKDKKRLNILKIKWIEIIMYKDNYDLINKINKFKNPFIQCFDERLISLLNLIKEKIWINNSTYSDIFFNKDLQRELLLEYDSDITVNYLKININDLNNDLIEKIKNIWFPLIVKPKWGASSRWVKILNNTKEINKYIDDYKKTIIKMEESWYWKINELLFEEYIDWIAWSIDYFVDERQNIYSLPPVYLEFSKDIWINDLANISRIIHKNYEKK